MAAQGSNNVLTARALQTDGNGQLQATLSSTLAQTQLVSGTVGGITVAGQVVFVAGPAALANSFVTASPNVVTANGNSTAAVQVNFFDAYFNPVPNVAASLAVSGSSNGLGASSGTSGAFGSFATTLQSPVAEAKVVTASFVGGALSANVLFVPGAISNLTSTFVASPNQVVADGTSNATLQVRLADSQGNPVANQNVQFVSNGNTDVFSTSCAVTNTQGQAAVTLAATSAGPRVLTAQAQGTSLSTGLVFLPGPASNTTSSLFASPNQLVADGISTTTLVLAVRDAHNNVLAGTPVVWSADNGPNLFGSATGSTDSAGNLLTSLSSTVAAGKTVTASVPGTSLSVPVRFVAGAPSPAQSSWTVSPSTITADGNDVATLTLLLRDAQNNLVSNQAVTLSATGQRNTFATQAGSTDGAGAFLTTLRSTKAQLQQVSLSAAGRTLTVPLMSVAAAPTNQTVSLIASPNVLVADGNSTAQLAFLAADPQGNPILNANVSFTGSGIAATFTQTSVQTDALGSAQTAVSGVQTGGFVAQAQLGNVTASASISFVAGSPDSAHSAVSFAPAGATADGNSAVSVSVVLRDAFGHPVPNQAVTLSASGSANVFAATTGTTDASGTVTTSLRSTVAETKVVTAAFAGGNVQGTTTFVAGPASNATSTLVASPNFVVADGSSTFTLQFVGKDAQGNAARGRAVMLSSLGNTVVFANPAFASDGNGVAQTTATSTLAGSKTLVLTVDSTSFSTNALFVAGEPNAAQTQLVASPNAVTADDTSPMGLSLVVRDAFANPVPNRLVTWGASGTANTFASATSTTAADGTASTSLHSSAAQTKTLSAQVATVLSYATGTFLAGSPNSAGTTVSLSPNQVTADQVSKATLWVTVADRFGNRVSGQNVTVAATGSNNVFVPPSGASDGNGQFVTVFSSRTAQPKTVTATAGAASANGIVTFVAGSPNSVATVLAASPNSVVADNNQTTTLTAVVRDVFANPVPMQAVTLASSGSGSGSGYAFAASGGNTDASGTFVTTLRANKAELKTVTLTAGAASANTNVTFVAGAANALFSSLAVSPNQVVADNVSNATVTVTVRDIYNNPVPGQPTTLVATGTGYQFAAANGNTDLAGLFVTTLHSSVAETKTITATAGTASIGGNVTFVGGSPNGTTTTFSVSPNVAVADNATPVTLTVVVRDAFGNLVQYQPVTFAAGGSNNTFAQAGGNTDASGTFATTLRSTKAQTQTVSYTASPATGGANVTFVAGSPNSTNTLLVASPNVGLAADNSAASTLTASVADAFGNPVANQAVSLASTGSSNTFGATSGSTAATGTFATTLRSSVAESKTVTLTAAGASASATVTFSAVNLVLTPANITAGGGNLVVASLLTANSSTVYPNSSYRFGATTAGTVIAPPFGISDANGRASALMTSRYAGNSNITAYYAGGLKATARLQVAATAPACTTPPLLPKLPWLTFPGKTPYHLAAADFNGDGYGDLAVTGQMEGNVFILLGNANDVYTLTSTVAVPGPLYGIAIGDFNNDSKPDLVVASSGNSRVYTLSNQGNGVFAVTGYVNTPGGPYELVAADFDADGYTDVAVANNTNASVSLLWNAGNANFSTQTSYAVGSQPRGLAFGQLNNDSLPDIGVACYNAGNFYLLLNQGARAFATPVAYTTATGPTDIAIGNLNKDAYGDIVVSSQPSQAMAVFLGSATGVPGAATNYTGPNTASAVAIFDFSNDGNNDVLLTDTSSNVVYAYRNLGTGVLASPNSYGTGRNPVDVLGVKSAATGKNYVLTATGLSGGGTPSVSILSGLESSPFSATTSSVGSASLLLVQADFNKDGRLDLAVANDSSTNPILFGDGNGNFVYTSKSFLPSGASKDMAAGDFNGDGNVDLMVLSGNGNVLDLFLGAGNGNFAAKASFGVRVGPVGLAVGDLDNNGTADAVTVINDTHAIQVFLGQPNGTMVALPYISVGLSPVSAVLADFNQDGNLDVAVATGVTTVGVSLYAGGGDGNLALMGNLPMGDISAIATEDLNGDGVPDLVVSSSVATFFYLNAGNGNFAAPTTQPGLLTQRKLLVADMTGDGYPDVLTSAIGDKGMGMYVNQGNGTFAPLLSYTVPSCGQAPQLLRDDSLGTKAPRVLLLCYSPAGIYTLTLSGCQ